MTETIVLVGCGSAKREPQLEPGRLRPQTWPPDELYTSTYSAKKVAYAKEVGDFWAVLSAEHGVFYPHEEVEPYDTSIDDVGEEQWAASVLQELGDWFAWERGEYDATISVEVLAGRDYVDPIRHGLDELADETRYPFDETSGIGEQMGWLTEQLEDGDSA